MTPGMRERPEPSAFTFHSSPFNQPCPSYENLVLCVHGKTSYPAAEHLHSAP